MEASRSDEIPDSEHQQDASSADLAQLGYLDPPTNVLPSVGRSAEEIKPVEEAPRLIAPSPLNGSATSHTATGTSRITIVQSQSPSASATTTTSNGSTSSQQASSSTISTLSNRSTKLEPSRNTFKLPAKLSFGTKYSWPNPKDSIGKSCQLLGKDSKHKFKCWEAKGPALKLNEELRPEVLAFLNSRLEDVWGKSKRSFLGVRIYMVGNWEEDARPFLIISGKEEPRTRALKLIQQSKILERFRDRGGVALRALSKFPSSEGRLRLASGSIPPPLGLTMGSLESGLVFYDSSVELKEDFGLEVYIRCRHDASGISYWNKATVGCVLRSGEKYLAWTAAHAFLDIQESAYLSDEESEVDFIFEDEENSVETHEDDPELEPKEDGNSQFSNKQAALWLDEESPVPEPSFHHELPGQHQNLEVFGSLFASSLNHNEIGLDWALVEITALKFKTTSAIALINGPNPLVALHYKPVDTEVFAITSSSGRQSGVLSPMPTYMVIPPSSMFQEVWLVRFGGTLAKGDCGCLVLDSGGNIYGHVAAGDLENGVGYIIPAVETLAEMKSKVGDQLSLTWPRQENWQETFDGLIGGDVSSTTMRAELPEPTRPAPVLEDGDERIEEVREGPDMRSIILSTPSVAPEARARRVSLPRMPVTLPPKFTRRRIRPSGTRKRNEKNKPNGWEKRIRYPRHIVDEHDMRAFVLKFIDLRGFDWLVFATSGSGIFAASYALFAPSMILPSLNFVYWPNSKSLNKNIQIRAVALTGAIVGSLISGFLADKYGRRAVYRLGPLLLLTGAICSAEASAGFDNQTMAFLGWTLFAQFMVGIGAGTEFTMGAVTTAEFAPGKARGRMMAAVLLMQSFASLVVSALALILLVTIGKNAGLRDNNDHSSAAVVVDKLWRFLIGLGAVPAALALFYRLTMPESPRWTLDVADDHRAAHDMRLYEYSPANIMESEYDDSIQLPQRRQEMAQVTDIEIVMGSLHRRSTISVPDSAIASVHSQRDFESEVEPQQISERDDIESAGGNEELPFPFSLSIPHALKRFFLIDGNWRSLTAIALCAFFINAAMSGLGGDNYRILAQVWSATSSHVNSTVPAYSDGQVNAPIAGSQIYETLYNLALHSIIVLSAGSFVGGAILIKIVDHLNRKQLLATGSLLIAPVLLVIFGILISDSVAGINAVKIVLYAICYFVFNLGPNLMLFMIPTELFPTQYRASAFAITFSFGKIGVLIGQTITTFYSTNSKGWIWYLLATVPLLFAAALFSWVWLPTYGKLRGKPDIRSSNMSTLEELARGRKGRKEIEWQGFGGAWKSLWRRSHQDSELSV